MILDTLFDVGHSGWRLGKLIFRELVGERQGLVKKNLLQANDQSGGATLEGQWVPHDTAWRRLWRTLDTTPASDRQQMAWQVLSHRL
jgi:hypothetical protein